MNFDTLSTSEGELLCVRWPVEARHLEDALDALAHAPFPINPHLLPAGERQAIIEFPAYTSQLDRLNRVIAAHGMDSHALEIRSMLEALNRAS